jgi:hypothetical protein
MDQMNFETEVSNKLKNEVLSAWHESHGGNASQVNLFIGDEGILLLIPKAFYQAELDLHRTTTGGNRVLNQYLRTLLATVAADFIPKIEALCDKSVDEVIPLIDLREGYVIAFYKFDIT